VHGEDLDRVEQALDVRLPPEYRAALLEYPLPRDPHSTDLWLVDDPDELVRANEIFRGALLRGRPWPQHYFYVGGDGGEESYFLDLDRTPAPVVVYDIELGTFTELAPDLPTWLDTLRRELEAIAEDERRMAEAWGRKKWWQFWIRPHPPGPSRPAT
jgi:hypothetical protein